MQSSLKGDITAVPAASRQNFLPSSKVKGFDGISRDGGREVLTLLLFRKRLKRNEPRCIHMQIEVAHIGTVVIAEHAFDRHRFGLTPGALQSMRPANAETIPTRLSIRVYRHDSISPSRLQLFARTRQVNACHPGPSTHDLHLLCMQRLVQIGPRRRHRHPGLGV